MDDHTLRVMMKEQLADRRRDAAVGRLRKAHRTCPSFRARISEALGNVLIRLGKAIKKKYGLGPEPVCASQCRSKA